MTRTLPASVPSSGRARRSCGGAAPAVQQHWGTPVGFATIDPAGLLSPSVAGIGADGPALETVPPGEVITDLATAAARFRASFDALTAAPGPGLAPRAGGVDIDVQIWRHGYDRPAAGHSAGLVAWWVLATGGTRARTDAGAIVFADPRIGSATGAVPGRPWGRSLAIRPVPGTHVAVPGWLSTSVLPLERGQHVLVAIASAASPAGSAGTPDR